MAKTTGRKQLAKNIEFKHNEPAKQIPGGTYRESVRVDFEKHPAIQRRLRLNRLLQIHDPEVAEESLAEIEEEDLPILRRLAQEGVLSGNEPALRRNAISVLGRFLTAENLNLLDELARYGEDAYVRGAALSALADTGIALALPALKEGLAARDPTEARRAQVGLTRLGAQFGPDRIRELLKRERRKSVRRRVNRILETLEEPKPVREAPPRRQTTAED